VLGNPVCEMILDRENTRLDSTCPLFTAENTELKTEIAELKAKSPHCRLTTPTSQLD
jgi:hypothetical protein